MIETWDYESYWDVVLGDEAAKVVADFKLQAEGLDEWLGTAESDSWTVGAGRSLPLPESWAGFHTRALGELQQAIIAQSPSDDEPDSERTQRADHDLDEEKDRRVRGER
jgi:hypothetical protein